MSCRIVLLAWLVAWGATAARAQSAEPPWPTRPIRLVAPLPPGSAADVLARLVGSKLADALGQPVIVENRDGGSGMIGSNQIAHADPDGYTLGIATTTTLVTAPILDPSVSYNAEADFTPIAMVGYSPYVFVTNPAVPARSIPEFVALAKAKPGALTYSSVGEASLARLGAELLSSMTGIKLTQVPYKSSTQAVIDLVAGRIDSQFGILTTTHQYIRDGKLRGLGVTTRTRIPEFKDIPTISESGVPGFEATLWIGLVGPARLRPDIVARLNGVVNQALNVVETKKLLFDQSIVVDTGTPEFLRRRIADDLRKWRPLAAKASL